MNDDLLEKQRLAALRSYGLLDTPADQKLDDLTALVAHICETPIAMISLVDEHRQWFKAQVGLEFRETPRELSFCAHSIQARELMVVPDATQDERFARNSLVTGEPHIRFYAAAPLVTPEGAALGTLCVIDRQPRTLQPAQAEALRVLSRLVMTQFDLHRRSRELQASEAKLRAILEAEPEGVHLLDAAGVLQDTNTAGWRLLEAEGPGAVAGLNLVSLIVPEHRETMLTLLGEVARGESRTAENQFTGLRGTTRWLEWSAAPFHEAATGQNLVVAVTRDTTARHADAETHQRAERALRVSDAALHAISQGVLITNSEELIIAGNEAFTTITGYTLEEVRGQNCRFLQGPLTDHAKVEEIRRCLDRGDGFSGEIFNYRKDGTPFWNELTISPVRDPHGELTHFIGVSRDVTPRKQAAEALAFTSEMLERTGELAKIGGWSVDLPTMKLSWTRETFRIAEIEPPIEPPLAEGINLFAPEARPTIAAAVQAAMDTGTPYDLELPIITAKGRHLWVRTQGFGEMRDGKTVRIYGTFQDITERKRAEEERLASEAKFRAIIDVSPIPMALNNEEQQITYLNPAFLATFGYQRADVPTLAEWWPKAYPDPAYRQRVADSWQAELQRSKASGDTFSPLEVEVRCKDGTSKTVLASAAPISEALAGEHLVVLYDITERKRAEKETAKLAAIVSSSDDAIIGKDLHGIISSWNRGAEAIFGYTAGEMVGTSILRLIPADRQEEEMFILAKIGHGESVEHFETLRQTKDGRLVHVSITASPIMESTGRIMGVSKVLREITERKRAEQALRDREQRLSFLLTHTPMAIYTCRASGDFGATFVSENIEALTGHPASAFVADSEFWLRHLHPDDAERVLSGIPRVFEQEQCEHEYWFRHADGTYRWMHDQVRVLRDASGQPTEIIGCLIDITAAKRTALALVESEQRLRTLVDTIPQQVWTAQPDGALDYVSQRVTDFFGSSAGDLLDAGWTRFVHPDDLPQCFARWTHSLDTGEPYAVEFRLKRASDASYRWHLGRAVALRDESGAITKWLGTNTDISERKEAEEKIRLSEERQELALAAGALGLWDWDVPSGRVLFDERWCEMLGYEVSEVEPRVESWRSLLHPDDRPDAEKALARHLAGDTAVYEAEFRLRHKSGQWSWILTRGKVVERDATGAAVRVTGTHMNLTERKQLEQQFLRSQRMESIGTLAGGIAHDLNNMLSPIMMSLAVLEMRFTDKSSTDLLSIISDSARKGAEMVSQILSFARGVEGRRVEVQLRHIVREVEKLTSETFLKNIRVRTIVPHDLWTVIGDPTQLHQVLLNLCVNARDAMPEGGTLTLSAENVPLDEHFAGLSLEAHPGAYVLLQVEDTGTGIPASVIGKIFDPFFTTKEVGKGTGLGLATTLTIIKSHGGFVRVESEPGRGAKFSIYLPAETESGPEGAAEAKAEMPRGHGELILVVDDEAAVRRITEKTLQLFGYRVILAADGTEALATYAQQRDEIAAVITDLNMPVMDGFAAIPALRRLNPQLPIIATTGLAVESQLSRVADLGIKHFLRKPCTAEALLKALKDALDTALPHK